VNTGGMREAFRGSPDHGGHVSCRECANWLGRCAAGFVPSETVERVRLCGRYRPIPTVRVGADVVDARTGEILGEGA
jgi:hypothetical protein